MMALNFYPKNVTPKYFRKARALEELRVEMLVQVLVNDRCRGCESLLYQS